jgi:hypothetical protein
VKLYVEIFKANKLIKAKHRVVSDFWRPVGQENDIKSGKKKLNGKITDKRFAHNKTTNEVIARSVKNRREQKHVVIENKANKCIFETTKQKKNFVKTTENERNEIKLKVKENVPSVSAEKIIFEAKNLEERKNTNESEKVNEIEKKNEMRERQGAVKVKAPERKIEKSGKNIKKERREENQIVFAEKIIEKKKQVRGEESGNMTTNIEYKGKGLTFAKNDGDFFLSFTRKGSEEDVNIGFKNVSPFLIRKALENDTHSGVESANVQRDGTLTVHCKTARAATKVATLSRFGHVKCEAKMHQQLNSSKGVVYCPEFRFLSEEEILDGLKSQGVTAIQRMKRRKPGEIIGSPEFTGLAFLTFNKTMPPTEIKVGYLNVEVKEFIPDPMRCYNCLKFGHTKKFCKGEEICGNCAQKSHIDRLKFNEKCKRDTKCANCGDNQHNAFSRDCPAWKFEKEIQIVKHQKKITFFNARKEVEARNPGGKSFAKVTQGNQRLCSCGGIKPSEEEARKRKKLTPPTGEGPSGRKPPSGEGPSGQKLTQGKSSSAPERRNNMASLGLVESDDNNEDEDDDMETS